MNDKKGLVCISRGFIENNKDELLALFSKFIPVHIENNLLENQLKYFGYSNEFRSIKQGEIAPKYDVLFTRCEDESLKIEFIEMIL